jgi:hypothetical protein
MGISGMRIKNMNKSMQAALFVLEVGGEVKMKMLVMLK